MASEHSAKTTDSDTCTETHISGWAVTGDIQAAWLGWSSASALLRPLDLDSAPSSCSQCGHGGGRHWGSMCRGALFLHMACNELSQPLMASLTEATRQNGSPSWQSDPAGCWTHHESLIRVWPGQCSCFGPSAPGRCVSRAPRNPPRLLEARVSRDCLDLPSDPRANQPDLWLPLLWSSVCKIWAVLWVPHPGCPEKSCPAIWFSSVQFSRSVVSGSATP